MVMSGREVVGLKVQGSKGTAADLSSDGVLVPVTPGTFRASGTYEQVLDTSRRGRNIMDYRARQGVGYTEITWEGLVQVGRDATGEPKAVIGYLLNNLLGDDTPLVDQVAATTAYEHRLEAGHTREYITIEHNSGRISGEADRQFVDCRVSEVSIRFNASEGPVSYTVTLVGQETTINQAASLTDHNNDPWRGWQGTASVGSKGANTRLISGEWTLRRPLSRSYTARSSSQQAYDDLYEGPLEVVCSLVLDFASDVDSGANINENPFAQADVTLTVTNGALFDVGDVIRIENELLLITVISGHDLTVTRGYGGTTDVQHADATDIYIENPEYLDFLNKVQTTLSTTFTFGSGDTLRTFGIGGVNFDLGDGPVELDNSTEGVRLGLVARGLNNNPVDSGAVIAEGGVYAAGDVTLTVDDGSLFTDGDNEVIQIENEMLLITAVVGNNLTVTRGYLGTTDAAHADGLPVYFVPFGPFIASGNTGTVQNGPIQVQIIQENTASY